MSEKKEWRYYTGFVNPLRVSRDGDVERLKDGEWHPVQGTTRSGIRRVCVRTKSDGKARTLSVGRLVAAAFLGKVPKHSLTIHINGDKLDNRAENLRIVSSKESGEFGGRKGQKSWRGYVPEDTGEAEGWRMLEGTSYAMRVNRAGEVQIFKGSWIPKSRHTCGKELEYISVPMKGGGSRDVPVHTLIAEAFLGKVPEGWSVIHRNGDRKDNRLENLELVENGAVRTKRWRPVRKYSAEGAVMAEYPSIKQAALENHRSVTDLGARLNGSKPRKYRDGTWFEFAEG